MYEYKKILVPVDGSEESDLAFERGLDFAELVKGEVTILHVSEIIIGSPMAMDVPLTVKDDTAGRRLLDNYLEKVKKRKLEIDSLLLHGVPEDEIVAASKGHDIIIMGSKGHSRIADLFLGNVAEKVVKEACCPVMVIRPKDEECKRKDR